MTLELSSNIEDTSCNLKIALFYESVPIKLNRKGKTKMRSIFVYLSFVAWLITQRESHEIGLFELLPGWYLDVLIAVFLLGNFYFFKRISLHLVEKVFFSPGKDLWIPLTLALSTVPIVLLGYTPLFEWMTFQGALFLSLFGSFTHLVGKESIRTDAIKAAKREYKHVGRSLEKTYE